MAGFVPHAAVRLLARLDQEALGVGDERLEPLRIIHFAQLYGRRTAGSRRTSRRPPGAPTPRSTRGR
jgi:hypothetical protein